MPFIKRRIAEFFLPEIFLSAIFTFLFRHGYMYETQKTTIIIMVICLIVGGIHLFRSLLGYMFFAQSKAVYLKVNLTAFTVFFSVNLIMGSTNCEPLYTYLFLPYKFFTFYGMSKVQSLLLINAVKLLFVFVVPLSVKKID